MVSVNEAEENEKDKDKKSENYGRFQGDSDWRVTVSGAQQSDVDSDLSVLGNILHCVESTGSEDVVKTIMDLTEKDW